MAIRAATGKKYSTLTIITPLKSEGLPTSPSPANYDIHMGPPLSTCSQYTQLPSGTTEKAQCHRRSSLRRSDDDKLLCLFASQLSGSRNNSLSQC